jgi:ParB family chromosome partitioning protein
LSVNKERRLGRGLEALLGGLPGWNNAAAEKPAGDTPLAAMPAVGGEPSGAPMQPIPAPSIGQAIGQGQPIQPQLIRPQPRPAEPPQAAPPRLAVDQIASNPAQPRQDFNPDELQTLAESIRTHGLLQPVIVRRVKDRYELVAGERRLQAAKRAGWTDVPVNVIDADDRRTAELSIVENLHRKDLNPLEKAASFQRYLQQYACTQEELAGRLKLDRSTIANLIRLLELPPAVQDAIRQGKITQGHARALLPLGDEREQVEFCQRIQKEGLNVRQTEEIVQEMIRTADREPLGVIGRDGRPSRTRKGRAENLAALEQQLRAALGTRVKITHDASGRGKLVIHFESHEDFERIRQHICEPGRPLVQAQAG